MCTIDFVNPIDNQRSAICPPSLSSQNSFSLSLDLDNSPDDQALATLIASPDQVIAIQIFGQNIQNAIGVSPRFEYNASQVTYQGFFAGNVLSNAQVLSEHGTNPDLCASQHGVFWQFRYSQHGTDGHDSFSHHAYHFLTQRFASRVLY